jgi:hypothetical protein
MAQIEARLAQLALEKARAPAGRPGQDAVEHLHQDAREKKLRPGDGRVRLPRGRALVPDCYHALGVVHRCSSRSTGASAISSRFPRPTATSRCTRCCSARTVRRSKCRSAPRRWTWSPNAASPRTGRTSTAAAMPATARRAAPRRGSPDLIESASAAPARRWSSWRTSRSTCSRTRSTCSRRRATSWRCRAMPPRSISPTRCIPTSATTRWPRGWTASWCRCAPSWPAARRVEIITAKSAAPKPQWLEFVVTGKARTAIRQQLKQLEHEDAVQLGHRMLDRALERSLGTSLDRLPQARLDGYLAEHRYPRLEALLADIALGNRMPTQVAQALAQERATREPAAAARVRAQGEKILITGAERGVVSFAQLLPCRSRATRSWATTPPARASSCTAWIARTWPNTASRRSAGSRSAGIARCPAISMQRCGSRSRTAPACWRRSPPRSRRPNPTSTASNTWSATATSR